MSVRITINSLDTNYRILFLFKKTCYVTLCNKCKNEILTGQFIFVHELSPEYTLNVC